MKNIWRLNTKTNGFKNHGQNGLLNFCKKENIIGIGWSDPYLINGINKEIRDPKEIKNYIWSHLKKNNKKTRGFSTASNILVDKMNIGDYVWTRAEGVYYIAKILSGPKYSLDNEIYLDYDLGFYRHVEYSKKFFHESEIPGKIISSFAARNTTQNIADKNNRLFEYTKSLFLGENLPKINLEDWIIFFSASDIEELVGLYLQVKKNLYVYTSTNKKSTSKIEFELVDKDGILYGVQVKTGKESINGNSYQEISRNMKIFLFATSDNVIIENNDNLIYITVSDITNFIKTYKKLLPKRINKWL